MIKPAIALLGSLLLICIACKKPVAEVNPPQEIDVLAQDYVRLALEIGQYDESFVDAYYGPDSLRPADAPAAIFPKDSLLQKISTLIQKAKTIEAESADDTLSNRAGWIADQLKAFDRRVKIFANEFGTFDEESLDLYGTVAPIYDSASFHQLLLRLDSILPGEGSVQDRFQSLANRFIIPKDKLDTVFQAAIAECRKRTKQYFELPAEEKFSLEFVSNKPWNGYNWYKGNYTSLIQINTDLNIFIDRAIDVGSHESYPGHHVYNMLLEKNLYHDHGRLEISMYPLFSPTSLIAEGTANYGIDVVFPGNEKIAIAKTLLLPLAGLDTTGITQYFRALEIKGRLNYARNEAARGMLNGTMTDEEAKQWMIDYALMNEETAAKSVSFIKANRTYVINYNYGMDLIKAYVENRIKSDPSPANRWRVFGELMSRQMRIQDIR